MDTLFVVDGWVKVKMVSGCLCHNLFVVSNLIYWRRYISMNSIKGEKLHVKRFSNSPVRAREKLRGKAQQSSD